MNTYIPVEFIIFATAVKLRTNTVSSKDVNAVRNKINAPLEFGDEDIFKEFILYNDKEDKYTVTFPSNLPMQLINLLTNL